MLIGKTTFRNDVSEYNYENDKFTNTEEELKDFAVGLNSPWGQADETYTIKYNCKDDWTEKDKSKPDWKCEYEVIGADMFTSVLYGFGDTPNDALQNCIDIFNKLQSIYNKENDCF